MMVLFLATSHGDIQFDDCLVDIEEPLREVEVLHGLIFERDRSRGGIVYRFTGSHAEWVRPREYRSRGERAGKLPKLQYGDAD